MQVLNAFLADSVSLSRGEIINASNNFQFSFSDKVLQDGRNFELLDLELDIFSNRGIQVTVTGLTSGLNTVVQGTDDAGNWSSRNSRIDGSTAGMTQNVQDLGTEHGAAELQRSDRFGVGDISRNAADEHVTKTLIEDHLDRHTTVGTRQKRGKGSLATREILDAFHIAVGCNNVALDKACVASFEGVEALVGRGSVHFVCVRAKRESLTAGWSLVGAKGRYTAARATVGAVGTTSVRHSRRRDLSGSGTSEGGCDRGEGTGIMLGGGHGGTLEGNREQHGYRDG